MRLTAGVLGWTTRRSAAVVVASTFSFSAVAAPLEQNAVRTSLASIAYDDCGKPAPGWVDVTFAPSGEVTAAKAEAGAFSQATVACVEARFSTAKVAPFDGGAQTFRYLLVPSPPLLASPAHGTYLDPVLPYDESRPIPAGYHVEERRRTSLLVAGGVTFGAGLFMLLVAAATSKGKFKSGDPGDLTPVIGVFGAIGMAVGGGLFLGGLSTKKVLARNEAAVIEPRAYGAELGIAF